MKLKEFQEIPQTVGNVPVFKEIYGLEKNPKTHQQEGEVRIQFGHEFSSSLGRALSKIGI